MDIFSITVMFKIGWGQYEAVRLVSKQVHRFERRHVSVLDTPKERDIALHNSACVFEFLSQKMITSASPDLLSSNGRSRVSFRSVCYELLVLSVSNETMK